jgi:hypothetical protein
VRSKKAETGPKSKNAFDHLGLSLLEAGSDLPEESNLGAAMIKCGEALNVVSEAMVSWVRTARCCCTYARHLTRAHMHQDTGVREHYLQPIARVLDEETKEYQVRCALCRGAPWC